MFLLFVGILLPCFLNLFSPIFFDLFGEILLIAGQTAGRKVRRAWRRCGRFSDKCI